MSTAIVKLKFTVEYNDAYIFFKSDSQENLFSINVI